MSIKNGHGGKIQALAAEMGVDQALILDFSASINPLGPPKGLPAMLKQGLESWILSYPPAGAEYFREALGFFMGIDPSYIIPGNGSTELIHLLPRLKSGGKALIVEPAFSEYRAGLEACDWRVDAHVCAKKHLFVPDRADREILLGKLDRGYDLVYLGRPGNPGGAVTPREVVLDLAKAQEKHGLLVLDQAFIDFCPQESLLDSLPDHPALIILGSLTKFYAVPGLRLGFMAAAPELIQRLSKFQPTWSINIMAQEAGRFCLEHHAGHAARTEELIPKERERLSRELSALGLTVFPSRANYLLARLGQDHPSSRELARALSRELILIRDCSNYLGLDENFFRVSIRLPQENDRLLEALKKHL